MKKLLIMALCLITCVTVFAADGSTVTLSKEETAKVKLNLNSSEVINQSVVAGFATNVNYNSDTGYFNDDPAPKKDFTLVVADVNDPKGALEENMYFFWKITYPGDLIITLKANGPMNNSVNYINWKISIKDNIVRTSTSGGSTTSTNNEVIGADDKKYSQETATGLYDNPINVHTYSPSDKIFVEHGYAQLNITTQSLLDAVRADYEGQLTLSIATP